MLSIGKLSAGRAEYYLQEVAAGAEEYYLGAGEAPGRWVGRSAAALGLDGEVEGADLQLVLDGRDVTGRRLVARQTKERMPGYDCTFNAPKSVSLLFALGAPDVRAEVSAAHDAAVDAALGVLEDEAARARRGKAGLNVIAADGFVAAAFRHRTSRAGDPHLHTHVVVANLAHAEAEDRWSALDGRQIYAWCRTAGFLYEAHLRSELTQRLGVAWKQPSNGIADVAGVPRPVIEHFSQRRREILDRLSEVGGEGGRAAQVATYATRRSKDTSTPYLELWAEWQERASALGFDVAALDLCRQQAGDAIGSRPSFDEDDVFERLASPSGLTRHRSSFDRREVIRALCDEAVEGATVDEIIVRTDRFLTSHHLLALAGRGIDAIQRADGTAVPGGVGSRRWTTPEMLGQEQRLIDLAADRRGSGTAAVDPSALSTAIEQHPTLSAEQLAMVARICGSGDGIEVVPGVAGSGKTFALAAARAAWTASGYRVIGTALSAQAARQLEAGAGIPSVTMRRLELDLSRPEGRLAPNTVVVVDEAAMVGTRALVGLLEQAAQARAKVVLIGDACQLPEIDAGGAFTGLARRHDPVSLTTNRRQHDPWERQALTDLRLGHARASLDAYRAHDRIHTGPDGAQATTQLVDRWWAARGDEADVLMLASRHDIVNDLNRQARSKMRSAGRLGPVEVQLGSRCFAVGDEVLGLDNDYRIGVLNGTRATVDAVDEADQQLILRGREGTRLVVPFRYAEEGGLTHGYAMTIHKAQGVTADEALVLVDESMSREAMYTAMSRGRQRNDLYLAVDDSRSEISHAPERAPDPIDTLLAGMQRSAAQEMAIEHGQLQR